MILRYHKSIVLLTLVAQVFFAPVAFAQVSVGTSLSISATVESSGTTTGDTTGTTTGGTTGGSGGGGGGGFIPVSTVIFSGRAYPSSQVLILKDGAPVAQTTAGPDAKFNVLFSGVSSGTTTFAVLGVDADGRRSDSVSFPLIVTAGVTIEISGIFIAPTIALDKAQVVQGDTLTIFGQSIPASSVVISVHSAKELLQTVKTDAVGAYLYKLDTSDLEFGDHTAKSKTKAIDDISPYSKAVDFKVAKTLAGVDMCTTNRADLNCDTHVNFIDYSIMAYWYRKPNPPSAIDLNYDGVVSLIDFSILAYYWTG